MDCSSEGGQRVNEPQVRIDQVGFVPFPTHLVLLGTSVMVEREQQATGVPGRRTEVDRGLTAVAPDL